jgi:diacylglycerol kinase family enzyme
MSSRPTVGERLWAITALVALVAALVLILVGLIGNLGTLIAVDACLVVVGLAGWYVVSRSGWIRGAAIVVGAAALLGAILLVFTIDFWWLRVILALVAVGVSVAAASRALRSTAAAGRTGPTTMAPPPTHAVLLMNPKSGGGKAERFHLLEECRKRGIEPIVLRPGDDLRQLAEDAVARGADLLGMAGGDGSQALIASVAIAHDIPLVVIPAGTRNHFALDLGVDRDDVVGAMDAFTDGVERRIDLATVNGRIFVNNCSLGLYARIVQSPEYRDAKLKTATSMLPDMLGPNARPFDLRYRGPDGTEHASCHLAMVSNNPYQLRSLVGFGTRERLDGGVLGIMTATIADAAKWEEFLALEAVGRIARFSGWLEWEGPGFQIDSGGPVELGVDGESLRMDPPLVFASLPGALRVRTPARASSGPTGRVQLGAWSTVVDLGRVALGRRTGETG